MYYLPRLPGSKNFQIMKKQIFLSAAALAASFVCFSACTEKPGPDPNPPGPGGETEDSVAVESIAVEPETLSLTEGGTYQLKATVSPENADFESILWTSSDESVATVDGTGLVTAVAVGEAVITASVSDFEAVCSVVVEAAVVVPDIVFSAVSGSYNSAGQIMNVTLEAADGSSVYLKMNVSGDLSGKYAIDASGEGKTISGSGASEASYYMSPEGEKDYLASGELDIEIPSGDYISISISGEVTTENGKLASLEAVSVTLPEMKHYELVAGDLFYYGLNDNGTSLFCIYLKDSATVGDGTMTFNTCIYATTPTMEDLDNLYLPDGEYVSAPGTYEEFTINDKDSESMKGFWYTLEPEMVTHYLLRGHINVSKAADIYTITGEYLETEYSGVTFTFTGTLIAEDYS